MDRIVNVKVGGNYISKDNKNAGVRGEANVTRLRITFDAGWDDFAKTVTFFDAQGKNPVQRIQGIDLIEDITGEARTYVTPIPAEPLAIAGEMSFIIEGSYGGKVQRSIEDKLVVKDSPDTSNASDPNDPTPDKATQLQGEIDYIKAEIVSAINASIAAETALGETLIKAATAAESANSAKEYAYKAEQSVGKTSYIGENGNWYEWDNETASFYDTGIKAQAGSTVYVGNNPPAEADVWVDPDGEDATYTPYIGANGNWYQWSGEAQAFVDSGVKAQGKDGEKPVKGVDYWTEQDKAEIDTYIDEKTEIIKTDVEGLQKQINEEAHFRGYLSTNAKIQVLEATPNDFAYSAESGTKWIYDAENGWQDSSTPVPDQLTPASVSTPLMDGTATAGESEEYARGDHRHPTDTTRVSVEEFNTFKGDLGTALDRIIDIQNSLIGGDAS